ncbi:hypothetical protein CJ195_19060 [Bacillus sp. UMB0899]|nr:hypothetical protein CJ195_19060 [Bacillus sp. UMB0899]
MLKKDLEKSKWLEGTLVVDRIKLKAYFQGIENSNRVLLTEGTTVMPDGMLEAEYRNIVTLGSFHSEDKTVDVDGFNGTRIYLKKSINPYLKEFLQDYIDVDTLDFLVGELKKYEVTLYDCMSFFNT